MARGTKIQISFQIGSLYISTSLVNSLNLSDLTGIGCSETLVSVAASYGDLRKHRVSMVTLVLKKILTAMFNFRTRKCTNIPQKHEIILILP